MNANELRIGSYVISQEDFDTFEISAGWQIDNVGIYDPIPLTEEWLLKFGFKNNKIKNFGRFDFVFDTPSFHPAGQLNSLQRMDNLKHVHQLQNLYFALTGDELTITQ